MVSFVPYSTRLPVACNPCGRTINPHESHYVYLGDMDEARYCERCYSTAMRGRDETPDETLDETLDDEG